MKEPACHGNGRALYRASLRIRISSVGLVAIKPTRRDARWKAAQAARRLIDQPHPASNVPLAIALVSAAPKGQASVGGHTQASRFAESSLDIVARNTRAWKDSVRWPMRQGLANVPTINIGPWGHDYNTPLERLHNGYAFDVLSHAIRDLCANLLWMAHGMADADMS
ncbi:hypothetical protein [Mesorhizobium argentiipisi]|uniref:Uncharacterized protein n=1 Tax=Mesorhizobium argentiipisi TaxID=3015175 RepID=A0ABU8K687_9HYPH